MHSSPSPSEPYAAVAPRIIALITDAWAPQVNGVVRTLQTVVAQLQSFGHRVEVFSPDRYRSIPCPTYPEIRLAVDGVWKLASELDALAPDILHIATEGPLGLAARRYCVKRGVRFTTSFHTKFPEYVEARFRIPARNGYRFLRWFHRPAERMMVATPTLRRELEALGFTNCANWTRGVDTELFHPNKRVELPYPRPIHLYVGRVAVEKNIEAFLSLPLSGTKLVVGDGPQRKVLETRYPDAVFVGAHFGEDLARDYASADCFVFPSLTDTFGLVMLEALASGTPVAAFPVTGPVDVIRTQEVGCLYPDLEKAIGWARELSRDACRAYALRYSWESCAKMLEAAFVSAR